MDEIEQKNKTVETMKGLLLEKTGHKTLMVS